MEKHNLIVLGQGIKLCYIKQPKPVKKVASLQIINNNNNNNSETGKINREEEEVKTTIINNINNEREKNLFETEIEKNKINTNNNSTTTTNIIKPTIKTTKTEEERKREEQQEKHLEQQNKQMLQQQQQKHLKEEEKHSEKHQIKQQTNLKHSEKQQIKQEKNSMEKQKQQRLHRRFSLLEALNNGTIEIPNIKYSLLSSSDQQQQQKNLNKKQQQQKSSSPFWNEMFFPLISSSNNKYNSTYLKPGKFPVNNQQDINENLIDFSNFSSSIGALDLKQKKQQRSRSQPGIIIETTKTNNNKLINKNLLIEDFIETDCCCNEINNKNNKEEIKEKLENKIKIIGESCCSSSSNDSGVSRSSTHSTGSLNTNNNCCCCNNYCCIEEEEAKLINFNKCFCFNMATTSNNNNNKLSPLINLIANKNNSGGGGVLFIAEAVFENVAMLRDELPFSPGDEIAVLDCPSDELWYGICGPRSGWFPAAYIRPKNKDLCRLFLNEEIKGENINNNCLLLNYNSSCEFPSFEMRKLRRRIIQELINTEREYVGLLENLVKGFIEQCRRRKELFSDELIQRIFGNLELINSLHKYIFNELNNILNKELPEKTCLANVFLKNSQQFGIYTDYCNNRTISCTELIQLEKQPKYFHFFEACRLLCGLPKLSLDSFLLTPVQRICRYPLQLLELLKATPLNHPDKLLLQLAQQTMRQIATKVNDGKRRIDSIQKIWLWQRNVHGFKGPNLIENNHRLLISGELQCRALLNGQLQWSKNNGLLIYLFDQTIVLCKKDLLRRNNLIFKERMGISNICLYNLNDGKDFITGLNFKNSFKLSGQYREYIFSCPDSVTKNLWLEAIQNRPKPQPPSQTERRLAATIILQ